MDLRKEIELWLDKKIGSYQSDLINDNQFIGGLYYSKPLFCDNTLTMIIKPPIFFDYKKNITYTKTDEPIMFFIYDAQTDLIVGHISEIQINSNWKDKLWNEMILIEERLEKSFCPKCDFWLLERINKHGHRFMGCSGFPDCDFSSEIGDIYFVE